MVLSVDVSWFCPYLVFLCGPYRWMNCLTFHGPSAASAGCLGCSLVRPGRVAASPRSPGGTKEPRPIGGVPVAWKTTR